MWGWNAVVVGWVEVTPLLPGRNLALAAELRRWLE